MISNHGARQYGMDTAVIAYYNTRDALMPAAVAILLPIVIVCLFIQKTFITDLTSGSVKG